jgi:hypothetical protein
MGQMQEHGQSEVASRRVAAEEDARGISGGLGSQDVAEGLDGLAELGGIRCMRGEGVAEEEECHSVVLGLRIEVVDDLSVEVEEDLIASELESSA